MTTPNTIQRLAESVRITPQTDIEVVRLVEAVRAMGEQVETVGDPDARTIAHLAEQIERLQAVIRNADASRGGDLIGPLIDHGVLLPGDMKSPA